MSAEKAVASNVFPKETLVALCKIHAENFGLDPALVWGVVQVESGGNPNAKNPADPSAGLMQVTPLIGRAYGGLVGDEASVLKQLLLPDVCLRAGCGFIAHLQKRYGQQFGVGEWIQAYNEGETQFNNGVRVNNYGRKVVEKMLTFPG